MLCTHGGEKSKRMLKYVFVALMEMRLPLAPKHKVYQQTQSSRY